MLILDFWHAADHPTELAKVLQPDDEERRQELVTSGCHTPKHEGSRRLADVLRTRSMANLWHRQINNNRRDLNACSTN